MPSSATPQAVKFSMMQRLRFLLVSVLRATSRHKIPAAKTTLCRVLGKSEGVRMAAIFNDPETE
jgi:hypothetical protein